MFKFVIAISESGGGTLVTGAFRVPNTKDYGCKELSGGNNAFKHILDYEVKTNIKTIETDTGFQFRKMLNGHKYNEELLEQCHFITADYLKEYEEEKKEKRKEKRKAEKTNRKQK